MSAASCSGDASPGDASRVHSSISEDVKGPSELLNEVIFDEFFAFARELGVPFSEITELRGKLKKPKLVICIIALMKAGKSSIGNALMNAEFLPSSSSPETSYVTHIVHDPDMPNGRLLVMDKGGNVKSEHEGVSNIRSTIKDINRRRRDGEDMDLAQMILKVSIPSFSREPAGSLTLVDTPGPNDHNNLWSQELEEALGKVDVCLYVLDYTRIGSEDEKRMFRSLADIVSPLLKAATGRYRRFFYFLNKIDNHQERNDRPIPEIVKYVAGEIRKLLPEGTDVDANNILPISANAAVLARQISRRKDKPYFKDFLSMAMGVCYASVVPEDQYEETANRMAEPLEVLSNFKSIEEQIIKQIIMDKAFLNTVTVCEALDKELDEVKSKNELKIKAARATMSELEVAIDNLNDSMNKIKDGLDDLQRFVAVEINKISATIDKMYDELKNTTERLIRFCFLPEKGLSEDSYAQYKKEGDRTRIKFVRRTLHSVSWFSRKLSKQLESKDEETLKQTIQDAAKSASYVVESVIHTVLLKHDTELSVHQSDLSNSMKSKANMLYEQVRRDTARAFRSDPPTIDLERQSLKPEMSLTRLDEISEVPIVKQISQLSKRCICQETLSPHFTIGLGALRDCWIEHMEEEMGKVREEHHTSVKGKIAMNLESIQNKLTEYCNERIDTLEQKRNQHSEAVSGGDITLRKLQENVKSIDGLRSLITRRMDCLQGSDLQKSSGAIEAAAKQAELVEGDAAPKCYLENTALKGPKGNLLPVGAIKKGDTVVMCNGKLTTVVFADREKKKCNIVELTTSQAKLSVTECHHMVGPDGSTRLAKDLKRDMVVMVGTKERKLTNVATWPSKKITSYRIAFMLDGPVEAISIPEYGMQTRGDALVEQSHVVACADPMETDIASAMTAMTSLWISRAVQEDELLAVMPIE